jgi:heme/copper-type cytochrome/quinol oxidase subunit 3
MLLFATSLSQLTRLSTQPQPAAPVVFGSIAVTVALAIVFLIVGLLIWVTAIILAFTCNKGKGFGGTFFPVVVALFIPELYLLNFGIKAGILRRKGWCGLNA